MWKFYDDDNDDTNDDRVQTHFDQESSIEFWHFNTHKIRIKAE